MAGKTKRKAKKRSLLRRLMGLACKLFLVIAAFLIVYGIYLDSQIRERIDGKVWDLPAAVYGRMINLEPGMAYSQKEMVALLEGTQYRKVDMITQAGDFTVKGNQIEMLRRPFDFPDAKEGQIHARLIFNNNRLDQIVNVTSGREFGFFRLDPKLITMLQSPKGEQRLFVPRAGFPKELVEALLVTEDRHFYDHDGINPLAIIRAFVANISAGKAVQGGSTLTQQLVKNLFLTNERSISRKAKEAIMALIVDYRYDKDRILELYFNEVYLGQSGKGGRGGEQIRGFPLASFYYFGRPVNELSLDQQAMLVAMVKGAGLYNPWRNPDLVLERRNLVLKLLRDQKTIDEIEYQALITRPLGVQSEGAVITPQPAFVQLVLQELHEKLGDKVDDLSGVKIFTTLDPVSQNAAEKAVEEGIPALRKARKVNDLETAMVIVDRLSGEVRALVGGSQPQYAGFNRALQARRPIGSLAKPPVYLTALNIPERYQLNTWLADQPLTVPIQGGKPWQPRNYDRKFRGQVMLVDALAQSLNIPTVNLGLDIGLDRVTDMMIRLGAPQENIKTLPAMLLGSTSLTPIEVAQVYQTIGSGGHRAPLSALRSVIAEDGTVRYQSYPHSQLVVPPQPVYLTLYAMQQAAARGTGSSLAGEFGKYSIATKTGTTNDLRDSWFAGIDGKEVVIAWVGRDNNQQANLTGANGALNLFRRYMQNQTPMKLDLRPPEGINTMSLDNEGFFTCETTNRVIPAWINDPQVFCMMSQKQEPPISSNNQPVKEESGGFSGWLKDLFS
jgi:penicillin-binding protein 1B